MSTIRIKSIFVYLICALTYLAPTVVEARGRNWREERKPEKEQVSVMEATVMGSTALLVLILTVKKVLNKGKDQTKLRESELGGIGRLEEEKTQKLEEERTRKENTLKPEKGNKPGRLQEERKRRKEENTRKIREANEKKVTQGSQENTQKQEFQALETNRPKLGNEMPQRRQEKRKRKKEKKKVRKLEEERKKVEEEEKALKLKEANKKTLAQQLKEELTLRITEKNTRQRLRAGIKKDLALWMKEKEEEEKALELKEANRKALALRLKEELTLRVEERHTRQRLRAGIKKDLAEMLEKEEVRLEELAIELDKDTLRTGNECIAVKEHINGFWEKQMKALQEATYFLCKLSLSEKNSKPIDKMEKELLDLEKENKLASFKKETEELKTELKNLVETKASLLQRAEEGIERTNWGKSGDSNKNGRLRYLKAEINLKESRFNLEKQPNILNKKKEEDITALLKEAREKLTEIIIKKKRKKDGKKQPKLRQTSTKLVPKRKAATKSKKKDIKKQPRKISTNSCPKNKGRENKKKDISEFQKSLDSVRKEKEKWREIPKIVYIDKLHEEIDLRYEEEKEVKNNQHTVPAKSTKKHGEMETYIKGMFRQNGCNLYTDICKGKNEPTMKGELEEIRKGSVKLLVLLSKQKKITKKDSTALTKLVKDRYDKNLAYIKSRLEEEETFKNVKKNMVEKLLENGEEVFKFLPQNKQMTEQKAIKKIDSLQEKNANLCVKEINETLKVRGSNRFKLYELKIMRNSHYSQHKNYLEHAWKIEKEKNRTDLEYSDLNGLINHAMIRRNSIIQLYEKYAEQVGRDAESNIEELNKLHNQQMEVLRGMIINKQTKLNQILETSLLSILSPCLPAVAGKGE